MDKPKEILELEKLFNETFRLLPNDSEEYNSAVFYKNLYSFNVNEDNEVVQLNLSNSGLDDLNFLKKFKKLTHLKLSANKIIDIEPLLNLEKLEFLDLSTNMIKNIGVLNHLKKIKNLYLDNNSIESLPLFDLPELEELWLYSNQISNISNLKDLKNLFSLNISNNQIHDISVLKGLTKISHLDISNNKISKISALSSFKEFVDLRLNENKVADISPLKNIKISRDLFLGQNLIMDLSPLYNSLKLNEISFFNVFENKLLKYPPIEVAIQGENSTLNWFEDNLEFAREKIKYCIENGNSKLDLGNCGLTDLSMLPELFSDKLRDLQELILSNQYASYNVNGNYWDRIDSPKGIYPNNISNIPNSIKKLSNLKKLIVGGDWRKKNEWNRFRIKSISNIQELKSLEFLNCSNNQISMVGSLNKLSNLKTLHINNNYIKNFSSLGTFDSLNELFVSNNNLIKIDFLKDLKNIKTIDLHSNRITDLSLLKNIIEEIGIIDDKWKTNTICVNDNPLKNPAIEFVRRGKDAVINIINENAKGNTFKNKDLKLILVGNSEVGKTTLAYYLKDKIVSKVKPSFTLWLNQIETKIDNVNVRIFDFGGHDYYHDTHHIFFGNNQAYILLWDKLTNNIKSRNLIQEKDGIQVANIVQDYPLEYWLDSINFFIKPKEADNFEFEVFQNLTEDSYSSKALVIQNKVSHSSEIQLLNNLDFKNSFKFIYDFMNLDILSERNLKYFDLLIKEMISEIPILNAEYPRYYEVIKEKLKNYTGRPILTLSEFREYCNTNLNEIIDEKKLEGILIYLDAIGVLLYNKANVFIDLKKLSEDIIKIFSNLNDKDKEGVFSYDYASAKLGSATQTILQLMIEFKMIFVLPQKDDKLPKIYIAPLYLNKEPSKLVKMFTNNLVNIPYRRFIYQGFMHKNVVLDLFSEYGKSIFIDDLNSNSYYWKNGLILKNINNDEIVMVQFNEGDEKGNAFIDLIRLKENNVQNNFLDDLIKYITKINRGYDFEEMVTLDGKDFVSLKLLKENAKEEEFVFLERSFKEKIESKKVVPVKPVYLKNYKMFVKKELKMKKIFISYSNEDFSFKKDLEKHLKPLKSLELAKSWSCEEMTAGLWDEQIQNELKSSDIVIFMLSINFVTSDYILKNELFKVLFEMKEDKTKNIICVLVRDFSWRQYEELFKLTGLAAEFRDEDSDSEKMSKAIAALPSYQFLPYKIKGIGNDTKRYIEAIEEWEFKNKAYMLVIDEVIKLVK